MTCALFVALVLLADAGASSGDGARIDLYGDSLPPGAVARLGTVRLRHADAKLAFSKDGKRLISCGCNGEIRIWDAATGRRLRQRQLPWPREESKPIVLDALSPNGETVVGWEPPTGLIYDTETGQERSRIPSVPVLLHGVFVTAFSPDGKFLAVQSSGERRQVVTHIWDVAASTKRLTVENPGNVDLSSVAFTWDGKKLAGIAEKNDSSGKLGGVLFDLLLWDTTTGELLRKREGLVRLDKDDLAISPDDATLAVGRMDTGEVQRFEVATLKEKDRLKLPANVSPSYINQPTFSPDGRWLAAGYGAVPFNQPCEDGVLLWDLTGAKKTRRLPARYGARLAFAPDGKTLACQDGNETAEIRLYDTGTGRQLHQRPGHDRFVTALAVSANGQILASGDPDGVVRLWDTATSKQLRILEGRLEIGSCLFSPDGAHLVGVGKLCRTELQVFDERVAFQVWDVATGKSLRRIEMEAESGPVHAVALSAGGTRLVAVIGGDINSAARLVIWDLARGKQVAQRPYQFEVRVPTASERNNAAERMSHAAFTADGERMTMWLGDRVGIAEVATGCLLAELPRNVGAPLVFSPDGRLLAAALWQPRKGLRYHGDLMGLALIETASGQEVLRLKLGEGLPESGMFDRIAFTADSRSVFVTDRIHLTGWDTDTGARLYQRKQPEGLGTWYSGSGQPFHSPLVMLLAGRMATGMEEGDILVWDLAASSQPVRAPVGDLSGAKLDSLWTDLTGDARKAHRAIYRMAAAQSVPFLKDRLQPPTVDTQRVEKLMADLDSDSFSAREAASRELTHLHYRVEPVLRRVLAGKPSLEVRRRLESILAGPKMPSSEALRTLRAIAVLEHIGTPEARRILEKLSGGAEACETREAKAVLQRLNRR